MPVPHSVPPSWADWDLVYRRGTTKSHTGIPGGTSLANVVWGLEQPAVVSVPFDERWILSKVTITIGQGHLYSVEYGDDGYFTVNGTVDTILYVGPYFAIRGQLLEFSGTYSGTVVMTYTPTQQLLLEAGSEIGLHLAGTGISHTTGPSGVGSFDPWPTPLPNHPLSGVEFPIGLELQVQRQKQH